MKKLRNILLACAVLLGTGCTSPGKPLPAPEKESGIRGEQFGIDKNINEKTIDQYLAREDTVYRDMRMLKDEADYEAIGGDSYLSGYVEGFEIVPYPYLCNVTGLPEEVGSSWQGDTLYTFSNGAYTANYEESEDILEYLFPKDKYIILMCGGGGYAGMTKNMLVSLGWDEQKIYNAGGFWYYEGEHEVSLKREENGKTYYDFYKAPYHTIAFETLHRTGTAVPETEDETEETAVIPRINADELVQMTQDKGTFALFITLPGCTSCAAFAPVIDEYAQAGLIDIYEITLSEIRENDTVMEDQIEYTPAVVIISDGEIISVLKADSDEDIPYYKNVRNLSEWFHKHIGTDIIDGKAEADIEDCEDACEYRPGG